MNALGLMELHIERFTPLFEINIALVNRLVNLSAVPLH